MHLKSLTVRGFKSFASATTFDFEPGITAVVGPNGSGKSNVVDALAWVMGEQGAKTLRGGKMEDVIFAGTAGRPPLGRAHVSLTIDNSDGALPIEYSEVTIARTLFRAGGSEYAINGNGCRLLDIQELLSDSGLGREMHVIVGQGQLDRVLHATPEDRRGFIEEAAGILKHRRRKEKSVRKLEAMQANLNRLTDLTTELRRQLTPLGRQADTARRAQQVQFDARDARARLLADDLLQLTTALEQDTADETALRARRAQVESGLEAARARLGRLEQLASEATPRLNAARDTWYRLASARDRLHALAQLASDRCRLLGSAESGPDNGRDPEQLQQQADRVRAEQRELARLIQERTSALDAALQVRSETEDAAGAEERQLAARLRAAADRREGLARLAGRVGAARSRVEAAEAELGRLRRSIAEGAERRNRAQLEFSALESQAAGAEEGEEALDADYEEANAELESILQEITGLTAREREAERERDALAARRDALREGLLRQDGSALILNAGLKGILGPVSELLTVTPGYETAIAAALGSAADAVAAEDLAAAARALSHLKDGDGGRAQVIIADSGRTSPASSAGRDEAAPDGSVRALDVVTASEALASALAPALTKLLGAVVIVPDAEAAGGIVRVHTDLTAVTREGDVFTSYLVRGGSGGTPSLLEVQAAVEETERRLREAAARAEKSRFALSAATARRDGARQRVDEALERLHESDARLAAVTERLGQLGSSLRAAVGESERLGALVAAAEDNLVTEQKALAESSERLRAAQDLPEDDEPSTELRDELARKAAQARQAELEARLALRTAEEQHTAVANRAASLERAVASERRARIQAEERARRRALQAAKAAAVRVAVGQVMAYIDVSVAAAGEERDGADRQRTAWEVELAEVRRETDTLQAELAELSDSVHRDEMARAQQRLRIEALENRAAAELGMTAEVLIRDYGHDDSAGVPFNRQEQEKRLRTAERDLASLGKINPLALEEFAALEERHQFLSDQLADLKASRRDLLDIIREVDQRVEEVFAAAYADTAAQFERVFARLFPGGEGRLLLTDPDDLLTSGVEVEARPAGKKIKRLSLLSGGERSLTAVALLVAIFKARPSPFYVMDEVEAALDDTNLGRLITILEELRESSQLIVITHQKRTMEVADALYGVTMRGDGVSTVISQRMRTAERV